MTYEIIQEITTHNRPYTKFKNGKAEGIVVHETATPGASDQNESKFFDRNPKKASAHVFVDWDSIRQKIPFNENAWHAGKTANARYIGVELCHVPHNIPRAQAIKMFQEVWKRGVWCFAYIYVNVLGISTITKTNLPSHADCSRWWKETDHMDPESYFAEYGKKVDDFRVDVQTEINNMLKAKAAASAPQKKTTLEVTSDVLICKGGAASAFPTVNDFAKGAHLTGLGDPQNGWWKIDLGNNKVGYVPVTGISIFKPEPVPKPVPPKPVIKRTTLVVEASKLNCRSGASTTSLVINKFLKGANIIGLGDPQNGWWKIDLGNNKVGYVSAEYVTKK